MADTRKHEQLAELTGAYALDALEADEAERFERHLRECPKCEAEVASYRETAALLAHSGSDAPADLWERLVTSLDEAPPEMAPILGLPVAETKKARPRFFTGALAAAAAAVIAVNGAVLVRQNNELQDLRQTSAQRADLERVALAAAADPLARISRMRSADGKQSADAVVLPDGRGYLIRHDLPELEPGRAYQLWAVVDGAPKPVSLGVLGRSPAVSAFSATAPVSALALSVEPAAGSAAPTIAPVLAGELRSRR